MYKKSPQGWMKHWDFILLDIFCLQLAFVVAYLVRQGLENPYSDQIYRTVAFVFMLCQIVVMFLGQSYQDRVLVLAATFWLFVPHMWYYSIAAICAGGVTIALQYVLFR